MATATTTTIISELLLLATRITTRSIDPSTASYHTCCHSYLVFLLTQLLLPQQSFHMIVAYPTPHH